MFEALEVRQMMSSYFVNTDADYAALNSRNLSAGDVVLLKGGVTFHGMLYLDSADGGDANNPVTITSYDPATGLQLSATAPASSRATLSAGNGDAVFAYDVGNITLKNLNVVGSGASSNTGTGLDFYSDLPAGKNLGGVTIDQVEASGFGRYGVAMGAVVGGGFDGAQITNVDAHANGLAGITAYGPFAADSGRYAHHDLYVGYSNAYDNAGFRGRNSPTGSGIVLQSVDDATIEYSTAYNNGANNTNDNGPVGIWVWESNAVTIQYNESYNNRTAGGDGGGFDLDGGVTNSVMQYNYSHDNAGSGLGLFQFAGAGTWANNVVRYNVSSNNGLSNGKANYEIFVWPAGETMTNAQVYGNTLIVNSSQEAIYVPTANVTASLSDNTIQIGGLIDTTGVGVAGDLTGTPVVTTTPTPTATPTSTSTPTDTTATTSTSSTTTTVITTTVRKHKHHRAA